MSVGVGPLLCLSPDCVATGRFIGRFSEPSFSKHSKYSHVSDFLVLAGMKPPAGPEVLRE